MVLEYLFSSLDIVYRKFIFFTLTKKRTRLLGGGFCYHY
jgi:hypothetical protein